MSSKGFKKHLLASAIAVAITPMAYGQTIQDEEVIITGIKSSLIKSRDLKREARGVVDAISAEDIGKFPDTNLAESLQRITGVAIQREDGEGTKITVRGLGPDFNLVMLNGRQMPGSSVENTDASGSRSFDFGNLASESVSGVEVYKTVRAENATGGMGATVNIKTARPLDNPGLKLSGGVKTVFDQSSENPSATPELSGIYSQTFADDTVGVAISGSYQNRKGGSAQAEVGTGWRSFAGTADNDWGGTNAEWGAISQDDVAHVNRPEDNDVYSIPQQLGYRFTEFERTRVNGQAVLQFAPTENFTATLDYTYADNEKTSTYSDAGAWFNFGASESVWTTGDAAGSVETPLIYSEIDTFNDETGTGGDLVFGVGQNSVRHTLGSLGLNLEWQATEKLRLELDAHSSTSESRPDSPYGNSVGIGVSHYGRDVTTANFEQDFPVLTVAMLDSDGNAISTDNYDDDFFNAMQVSGSYFRRSQMKNEIDQLQLRGFYDLLEINSFEAGINFGVTMTEADNRSAYSVVQRDSWGGLGEAGDLSSDFFSVETIGDRFDAAGSDNPDLLGQRVVYDFEEVRAFAAENYSDDASLEVGDCGTPYCSSSNMTTDRQTTEETTSAYVQFNSALEFNSVVSLEGALGFRYESTDVVSGAELPVYTGVSWQSVDEFNLTGPEGESQSVNLEGGYDVVLPSIDLSARFIDDIVTRVSYGKSISRPSWKDIQGGLSVSGLARIDGGGGESGNPDLDPYKSTNLDVSFEYYYGDANYVSLGWFKKDVEDFIGSGVDLDVDVFDSLPHPGQGERAQAAIDAGATTNDTQAIQDYIVANAVDGDAGIDLTTDPATIYGIAGEDPNVLFDITRPANNDDTLEITGIEVAIQQMLWESGFGFQANATIMDTDANFDDLLINENQFALTGASDTINLVGFYDNNGLQVRLAYNWRDDFLSQTATSTGPNPVYTEAYSQFDLNASYEINDNFTVFVEGLNITDEYRRTYGRSDQQTVGVYQGGARYNLGFRFTL